MPNCMTELIIVMHTLYKEWLEMLLDAFYV